MELTTEKDSNYHNLHELSLSEILESINEEDQTVPMAVKKSLKQVEALAAAVTQRMKAGGRLFYIGAGTSGRLGVLDASECPPTFGVSAGLVIGLIAGGDTAIRKAVENAEDDPDQAWKDMEVYGVNDKDVVVGIAASGTTPYVVGGLRQANAHGITTGCVVCNAGSPVSLEARYPVEVVVGPEFLTGSTRMKAGTAQKLVLNMLTTSVMIGLGKVRGNKMIDMQLNNSKLYKRGVNIIMKEAGVDEETAEFLLKKHGSIRQAVDEAIHLNH